MRSLFFFAALISIVPASAQQPSTRIAYVDTEYVMSQMPEVKQMEEKLRETQTRLQNDFKTKQETFQKRYQDFTQNGAAVADSIRERNVRELQEMQAELQNFQSEAQNTIENTRKLYMAPLYLKVGNGIREVATKQGYAMVIPMDIGSYNFVLHADPKLNISELVVEFLLAQQRADVTPDTTGN